MSWTEFMLRANELLRRPHDRSMFGFRSLLQIVIRHPTSLPESWDILSPDDDDTLSTVIVRTWHQELDFPDTDRLEAEGFVHGTERFRAMFNQQLPAQPTISETEFQLDSNPILALVAQIRSLNIPMTFQQNPPTGIVSYELILGNTLSGVSFRWWDSGPAEWREMIRATHEILDYLQASMPREQQSPQ